MVRTKLELKLIEDVPKRRVTFSKRRNGLMKKASELSVLCNADVGVIVFSNTGKLHEFASSSMQGIINRYNRANGPSVSQAQPDLSHLLAQKTEEIKSLKEEVTRLESNNMSLAKELEEQLKNRRPICYKNANLEMALTLRPPSPHTNMRMNTHRVPKREYLTSQMNI